MNQTRILLGVCLAMVAVVGLLFYQQQKSNDRMVEIAAALAAKNSPAAPAAAAPAAPAPTTPVVGAQTPPVVTTPAAPAPGAAPVNPANPANPVAVATPPATPDPAAAEKEREAARQKEMAALRAEIQTLKGENTQFFGEMQRAKLEQEERLSTIRNAPMLAHVTDVVGEQGIVVIDAGSSNNINPGEEFSIRRDASIICRIKITPTIDPTSAAATIVPGTLIRTNSEKAEVKKGDEVVKMD